MARELFETPKDTPKTSTAYGMRADFKNVGNPFQYVIFYAGDTPDTWPADRGDGKPYEGFTVPAGGIYAVEAGERITVISYHNDVKIEVHEVGA